MTTITRLRYLLNLEQENLDALRQNLVEHYYDEYLEAQDILALEQLHQEENQYNDYK